MDIDQLDILHNFKRGLKNLIFENLKYDPLTLFKCSKGVTTWMITADWPLRVNYLSRTCSLFYILNTYCLALSLGKLYQVYDEKKNYIISLVRNTFEASFALFTFQTVNVQRSAYKRGRYTGYEPGPS